MLVEFQSSPLVPFYISLEYVITHFNLNCLQHGSKTNTYYMFPVKIKLIVTILIV